MFFSFSCFVTWRTIHGVMRGARPLSVVHTVHGGRMSVFGSTEYLVMWAALFHLFSIRHMYCGTEQARILISRRAKIETTEGLWRWRSRGRAGCVRPGMRELMVSVEVLSIKVGS